LHSPAAALNRACSRSGSFEAPPPAGRGASTQVNLQAASRGGGGKGGGCQGVRVGWTQGACEVPGKRGQSSPELG
jgi:hypothetical protein